MNKKLMALIFCLVSTISNAQNNNFKELNKKVSCGPFNDIVKILMSTQYKEIPIWSGLDISEGTSYALFHNEKTGTFTLIEFNKNIACVLGEGTNSQVEKQI
jgi:hypothetical protein